MGRTFGNGGANMFDIQKGENNGVINSPDKKFL